MPLELPGLSVDRLSGPVSIQYLVPKRQPYAPEFTLPLFLLFGDKHRSETGVCEDCECDEDKQDDGGSCCLSITDKRFLQELDKMAQYVPVDFFTESSRAQVKKDPLNAGGILFHQMIRRTAKVCHDVTMRSQSAYERQCPTKNIRWHYSDVRFMVEGVEGHMTIPVMKLCQNIQRVLIREQQQRDFQRGVQRDFQRDFQPSPLSAFTNEEDDASPIDYDFAIRALDLLFSQAESIDLDTYLSRVINRLVELYFEWLETYDRTPAKSILLKQIRKQPLPEMQSSGVWKKMVKDGLVMDDEFTEIVSKWYELLYTSEEIQHIRTTHREFMQYLKNPATSVSFSFPPVLSMYLSLTEGLMLYFDSHMVDLHFLLRAFKSPEQNVSASLVMGFFGQAHIDSVIRTLLSDLFGYTLVSVVKSRHLKRENGETTRCLDLWKTSFPVYSDLQAHTQTRFMKDPASIQELQSYYQQLNRENKARRSSGGTRRNGTSNKGTSNKGTSKRSDYKRSDYKRSDDKRSKRTSKRTTRRHRTPRR